jgi:hypothetical protein
MKLQSLSRCGPQGIRIGIKSADANFAAILESEFGWGGRIRTFTVLINSEVSYQLDHAPAGCLRQGFRLAKHGYP